MARLDYERVGSMVTKKKKKERVGSTKLGRLGRNWHNKILIPFLERTESETLKLIP